MTLPTDLEKLKAAYNLDLPLLKFSENDFWTLRDAAAGTQVFGSVGAGKSSSSMRAILKSFLRIGMGGLICTTKKSDREDYEKYIKDTGRQDSLIVISPETDYRYNFLQEELNRTNNVKILVDLFRRIIKMGDSSGGSKNSGNEDFWDKELDKLLVNLILLVKFAEVELTIKTMYDVLISAPQNNEELHSEDWQKNSLCYQCLDQAIERIESRGDEDDAYELELVRSYWVHEFTNLAEKTRSIVVATFSGMANFFIRQPLRNMFSTNSNISLEATQEGAIILIDYPVLEFQELGIYIQGILRLLWQQATERRDINLSPRPVFLAIDESQFHVSQEDQKFITTARGSRACVVLATQSYSNYLAMLKTPNAKNVADSFLGNLNTKIYHMCSDAQTNEWGLKKHRYGVEKQSLLHIRRTACR